MPPPKEEIDPDFFDTLYVGLGFPGGSAGKESTCNEGDLGSIPGLGRSPGEGKGYPLQYSDLKNSMDYSPWGCKKSDTTFTSFHIGLAKCYFRFFYPIYGKLELFSQFNTRFQLGLLRMYAWGRSGVIFSGKKDRNIHSQRTKHEE